MKGANTQIILSDARSTGLPDRSVHMIATSPPYWGLRKYDDDPRQIGNEPTPEAYIENMRAVGREARRVLRDDGVMWMNLGDTYSSSSGYKVSRPQQSRNGQGVCGPRDLHPSAGRANAEGYREYGIPSGNIVGIPWRVAFALQSDGWILRAAIPWIKANGMPESVTNRPTVAHEYVFLFAKAKGYFFDADAVRMGVAASTIAQHGELAFARTGNSGAAPERHDYRGNERGERHCGTNPAGRNIRTSDFMNAALDEYEAHVRRVREAGGLLLSPDGDPLTFLVNPVPNSLGHFAMWPPKLVAPMILAGTSARGCCPTCGAQWRRRVEKGEMVASGPNMLAHKPRSGTGSDHLRKQDAPPDGWGDLPRRERTDLGFFPSCSCPEHEPIPSTVFDPFGGSGTTAQVAEALRRNALLGELNEKYHPLIRERLETKLDPMTLKPHKKASTPEQPSQGVLAL